MIKIEAATRLVATAVKIRKPSLATLIDNIPALHKSLIGIGEWYLGSTAKSQKNLLSDIKRLVDLFGYVPYNRSIYRVFPLDQKHIDTIEEGKTYNLTTAKNHIQSWTTTVSNALDFYMKKGKSTNYCVCKLVSSGQELLHSDWLVAVLSYLLTLGKPLQAANNMFFEKIRFLHSLVKEDYAREDEVIMLLPPKSKVQVIAVMQWKGKRRAMRKGAS